MNPVIDNDDVRVVVVDDVQAMADSLAELLELDGYKVRTAGDGHEALAVIEQYQPHCVMLDIDMPGIDGRELANRLRTLYGDAIVLIAVTGWGDEGDGLTMEFARFDHYLRKPFTPAQLRRVLPPVHE
jgi:CheY-like chemotaxis protein